jgi:hypothetical protein
LQQRLDPRPDRRRGPERDELFSNDAEQAFQRVVDQPQRRQSVPSGDSAKAFIAP